jgi:histidyl-tRNA synthetase
MQTWPQPVKLTMIGPMFRYDRPQAGRYRQFWQFDVEVIGDPGPAIDAEIIELAARFYEEAGLPEVVIQLNSIGDPACRPAYIEELTAYYRANVGELPALERARLERNPLRILDSKDEAVAGLNAAAPMPTDRLCDACGAHFAAVRAHLDALGVAYHLEPRLVRGLDYYTRTAFEVFPAGASGQQSAIGGGGRYDGLVELLGGRPTPGIGFGIGLDRVLLAVEARADLGSRKLGKQLEAAARDRAHFAVIIGDELREGNVQLRDLEAGTQRAVPAANLARELERATKTHRHGVSPEEGTAGMATSHEVSARQDE